MRFLLTIIFILSAASSSAFEYKKVIICGENLDKTANEITERDAKEIHYIHFGANNEFMIGYWGYHYTTFEVKAYQKLYNQNAAITNLVITEAIGDIIKFELQHLNDGWRQTLILDVGDLTYLARTFNGNYIHDTTFGVCESREM